MPPVILAQKIALSTNCVLLSLLKCPTLTMRPEYTADLSL